MMGQKSSLRTPWVSVACGFVRSVVRVLVNMRKAKNIPVAMAAWVNVGGGEEGRWPGEL